MPFSVNRRRLMQGAGATLGALSLRGFVVAQSEPVYFTHGVASGDPLADRVILWTRVLPGSGQSERIETTWQVAVDAEFTDIVASGVAATDATRDYTVKVDATGLQPDRRYFYRFLADGLSSSIGRTRTLPRGEVAAFRLGVASCSNYPQGYFNAYRHMAESDLDLILHLGDYIYEYPEGGYANPVALQELGRHVQPLGETLSLEDYRMRYGVYRTDVDLQLLHQRHPFVCVWDDHELTNNTWHSGAENHNPGEGDFFQRMRAARQAYDEWMPIRTHASGDQGPIYRSFQIGQLADLIMLDTRLHGRDRGLEYSTDLPLRSQVYDISEPNAARPVSEQDALKLPDTALQRINVPFDMNSGVAKPILDYDVISQLDAESLPAGWRYLPDLEGFIDGPLNAEERTILGRDQEQWLQEMLQQSQKRGSTWQIIGQQVLMGKLFMPVLSDEELQLKQLPKSRSALFKSMQAMAGQGLPFNLDAWDGYAACRARVQENMRRYAANPVVLAGDTHNAWAFNLRDEQKNAVGVEVGTPGITSPGMESFLPVQPAVLKTALMSSSPELVEVETENRGWAEVELTPQTMRARWHYVNTILDRKFAIQSSEPLECKVGDRAFSST